MEWRHRDLREGELRRPTKTSVTPQTTTSASARELRCKTIGEGGNLGLTQAARVEYALNGGRLNTDAIDNSGGVDMSDHEVNLKILLSAAVADGKLKVDARKQAA